MLLSQPSQICIPPIPTQIPAQHRQRQRQPQDSAISIIPIHQHRRPGQSIILRSTTVILNSLSPRALYLVRLPALEARHVWIPAIVFATMIRKSAFLRHLVAPPERCWRRYRQLRVCVSSSGGSGVFPAATFCLHSFSWLLRSGWGTYI